jgi:2-polyprenyl-3-methyl-5-hydroxy-6-metoxy-1,4-benzoquinol methylase
MLDTITRDQTATDGSSAGQVRMHTSCPACAGTALEHQWVVNGYSIARCRNCSLVFVENIVTPEELTAHYSGPDSSYDADNTDCLTYYYQILRGLIESRYPQRGRILDIGCSAGQFLDVMEGWDRYGNEISASFSGIARQRYGDRVVTGLFEDYPPRKEYFDVITLQDVFDHLRDPIAILDKCNAMLKPGGLIVIKVHNISCLYAKAMGPKFYAVMPPTHLFYYNKASLQRLLCQTGFQMVEARFIAHLLRLRIVFYRLARGNKSSLFYRIFQRLQTSALGNVTIKKNLHDIITVLAVKGGA